MLRIDKVELIDGVIVYGDDRLHHVFYLVPETPRFRLDEKGNPVFKFLKYRFPVDREDGKKGGGFCFFDVEFSVPKNKIVTITQKLQAKVNAKYNKPPFKRLKLQPPQVKIGMITYTSGTAGLLLQSDGGVLIEKVLNPGKPSLFGSNITPFALELSPEGSTLFWEAMQGSGGVVQVVYDLKFHAKLPPVTIHGKFKSEAFYSYYQTIDIDWNTYKEDSYNETIRENFRNSDSMVLTTNFGGLTDEKLKKELRDWGFRTLEDAAEKRMLEAIEPISAEERKKPEYVEKVRRSFSVNKISTFSLYFKEEQAVDWNINPQGTLPNITNLNDSNGVPLVWSNFAKEVDLNDPFFKQLNVSMQVNADFDNLPLHSVEIHLEYQEGNIHEVKEFIFSKSDDTAKFATYIENDNWDYKYWYEVNYKGEEKSYKSEIITTKEKVLTINVGDLGILNVDIVPGDLNFEQISQAQVIMSYQDEGIDMIENQFTLNKENPLHSFQHVIFKAQQKPYQYKVKYFMSDGKEYEVEGLNSRSPQLAINDPFSATKTVSIRTVGDLQNKIQNIYLDIKYVDKKNSYNKSNSIALNEKTPFLDWDFPVIDEQTGIVSYSGNISYKDGTIEEIEETISDQTTIMVGEKVEDFLEIQIIPQLIDFDAVKLAQVMLRYDDEDNNYSEKEDLIFNKNDISPKNWKIALKDKSKSSYRWQANFFMTDGTQRKNEEQVTDAQSIILELPNVK